jgi:hypothetical protein
MFTEKDLVQLKKRGVEVAIIEEQIKNFVQGFPYLKLNRAATIGDGVKKVSDSEGDKYVKYFEENLGNLSIVKFVPASGAATRMFKSLYSFMGDYKGTPENDKKLEADKGLQSMHNFFRSIRNFAFYDDLNKIFQEKEGISVEKALEEKKYVLVLDYLLGKKGLNYGDLPKGLLKFHKYQGGKSRTPVEEHLVEGAVYGKDKNNVVNLHFTVSFEHRSRFEALVNAVRSEYEKTFNVKYNISFSEQNIATDTIAVDTQNIPFREDDGTVVFRPAGHGALLFNMNNIDADLIFIKNIDNVVPDRLKDTTYRYKKILAGILLDYQKKIFSYIDKLHLPEADKFIPEIEAFLKKELCVEAGTLEGKTNKKEYLLSKLNRPIRVCGMVKNEGEPGGGPFWSKNPDGTFSLQIVESAQVDVDNSQQNEIFLKATHFNPVDLVCGVKNHKGAKFDLESFRDPETGFITKKSKDGRELKAQELPGLWNGSMSDWNTIFVEVPIITFNPVKTVNDLLREEHQ